MQVAEVSLRAGQLTQEEENILVDTITSSSRLQVLCVIGKDAGLHEPVFNATEAARYFRRNLRAGTMDSFTAAA